MSTSIGGGAMFFGEEVAAGWERRLAVAPSSSTRCCGGRRVGGGISVVALAGRWSVTVGLVTVTTKVVGGAVSCRRVIGLAAVSWTARARWLVDLFLGSCNSSVISSLTFRLPSDRVHKVFPVKANPAKAFVKVEGSSKLAAMLVGCMLVG